MGLGRSIVFSVHAILLFVAFVFIAAGLLSPRWQEIQFQQTGDLHWHGLWQDCTHAIREGAIGQWTCTYKDFSEQYSGDIRDGVGRNYMAMQESYGHHDNAWFRAIIICMLLFACLLDMIALTFVFITCCFDRADRQKGMRICAVIAVALEGIALVLAGASVIYFTRMAYEPEYRTVVEAGQTVREQQAFGVSFYIAMIGCVVGIISFFVGILAAVLSFLATSSYREQPYYGNMGGGSVKPFDRRSFTSVPPLPDKISLKDGSFHYPSEKDSFLPMHQHDEMISVNDAKRQQEMLVKMNQSPQVYRSNHGSINHGSIKALNYDPDAEQDYYRTQSRTGSIGSRPRSRGEIIQYETEYRVIRSRHGSTASGLDSYHNTPV